ncbi:peptidase [Fluviispira multicolorata]|uniref:Peptidase n=1 Tax=Fluviispira multicolorata TaxID=2654512 RepID=A0A833JBK4_9BACT|nr:peptidase [Fluviispira multicolorata]KAB8029711.1 peptidase [Fluviispira multicolorata]
MLSKNKLYLIPISFFATLSLNSYANDEEKVKNFIKEFRESPHTVLDRIPEKQVISKHALTSNPFSPDDINSKDFIEKKDQLRGDIMKKKLENSNEFRVVPFSDYLAQENPRDLVDFPQNFVDNIQVIDQKNIANARLSFTPWSDSYWPLSRGSVTFRYADPNAPKSDKFSDYDKYVLQQRPANNLIAENKIDLLSPAEKYDLLMNDKNFSLTNSVLSGIRGRNPEGWEGICHGWAPASYMYYRPTRSITVQNNEGKKITFRPSDIKALNSLLWANLNYNTKFSGQRCNDKDPPKDANGRIVSQNCFDSNPAAFHLALVNQIGINKRSFVFDASYDYTVWNQPILGYSYVYYNVLTGNVYKNASEAMINKNNYNTDPFSQYRSNNVKNIVGVKATIDYMVETQPSTSNQDDSSRDGISRVEYYYDLEIRNDGVITGGEWYQNAHPDFLWTPVAGTEVSSYTVPNSANNNNAEYKYHNFWWNDNPRSPLREWLPYSVRAAQTKQVPLENVVHNLNAWSAYPVKNNVTPELCTQQPCVPNVYTWYRN